MNDFTENDITQYRDAKRNTEMGKIALSIIQGIEKNSKIPPERAIWEMVQNAHDVSVEKGADIEFENARDYFYFRHNGIPFTYESINALNTQSSSKVQSNIRMIGQYGTGFMTTNKFGLVFEVSGSLCDGHNKYINFSDLRMDRSERDPKKLIKILDKQSEQIEGYLRELERSVECGKYTEFKYHKQYPIEKDNAYQAITRAPALVPYVLALINRINSIQFIDEGNNRSSFVRGVEETLEDGNYYIHKCITIHTANTNEDETPRSNKIFILDSKECIDNENIPKISVILPLREDSDSGKVTVFQFDHNVPNHFIFLPLIGTECWGVNYIFHSPLFQCNDELRDSVQFVSTGQYGDEECDRNKEIISIAGNMIDEFWKTHLLKYNNVKYVAKVRFGINDSNEKIATYNKELQKEWAERYKDYPIATAQDGKLTTPKSLKLLSYEFLDEVKKNQTLRDAVHYFIAKQYGSSCVPIREDLIYWSEIVAEWELDALNECFITVEDISKFIESSNFSLSSDNIGYLLEFDKFVMSNQIRLFDTYQLIPTEDCILQKKKDLLRPAVFNATLQSIMKVLIPEIARRFVHSNFTEFLDDASYYTDNDANMDIKECIENIKEKLSFSNKEFKEKCCKSGIYKRWNNNYLHINNSIMVKDGSINDIYVAAMIDYCSMAIKNDSGIESRLLKLVKEFHGYEKEVCERLNDNYKYSYALRALVYNVLYSVSITEQPEKEKYIVFIQNIVNELYNHTDWKDCLKNYMIYPNQNKEFKFAETLKRAIDIPDELKSWYDTIVLDNTSTIRTTLLDDEFDCVFIGESECSGKELADKVYDKVESATNWKINEYIHKEIVLNLLEYINKEEMPWQELFSRLDENKRAQIMLSTVDDPNKSASIFKFIRFDDQTKMAKLAALGENNDMDNIIALGKRELEKQLEDERDKEYKSKLGAYVENFLRIFLQNKMQQLNNAGNVKIDNTQGGQDLIISINGHPIYYIEVKSMWRKSDAIYMTMAQFKKSVINMENYALFVFDMVDIPHGIIDSECYDPIEENITRRVSVFTDIGNINKGLFDCINNINRCPTSIDLSGAKVRIPIDMLKQQLSLDEFCEDISHRILLLIN